jgi:hypothetical protein
MGMVVVIMLLAAAFCLCALAGVILIAVGFLGRKQWARRGGTILLVFSVLGLAACMAYSSAKAFNKVKGVSPKRAWQALVDAAFDDTGVPPLEPTKAKQLLGGMLTNTVLLDGVDVQGVWVPGAVLSYGYFVYTTDEKALLSAVANSPTNAAFQVASDTACLKASWDDCKAQLLYPKGPQRNLPGWAPEAVEEKRCYTCFRSPWRHNILVDGKTGKIYHSISEVRE